MSETIGERLRARGAQRARREGARQVSGTHQVTYVETTTALGDLRAVARRLEATDPESAGKVRGAAELLTHATREAEEDLAALKERLEAAEERIY